MGHEVGKDIYARLGKKVDNLEVRAPLNGIFYSILKELYSPEEAGLIVAMPYGLQTLKRISEVTGYEEPKLKRLLDGLSSKGLVIDLFIKDEYYYSISPLVIGIFEFTMMRRGNNVNFKKVSKLFSQYLLGDDGPIIANYGKRGEIGRMRALPYEEVIDKNDYVEILDFEKAAAIIEENDKFSIGYCSCRHEKSHVGEKKCATPIDNCSSFGRGADYLIRNNLAREVSKSEMFDNFSRSKELGLVLSADNTKKNVSFVCHCCSCCCNVMLGMKKFGYPNIIVTSSYISQVADETCTGCGTCAKRCPIDAIEMIPIDNPTTKKRKSPKIDESICLGCGVCASKCKANAMKLVKKQKRVIYPETSFERVILQSVEKGTLHYQIFDNPRSAAHKILRIFVGAFLNLPPTKKAIMSDMLRSSFLKVMEKGVEMKGRGFLTTL